MSGRSTRPVVAFGAVSVALLLSPLALIGSAQAITKIGPPGIPYPGGNENRCGPTTDTVPPVATSLTLGAHTVDVSDGNGKIPVTIDASDTAAGIVSGVKAIDVSASGPRGYAEGSLTLSSGDAANGVWTGDLTVRQGERAGDYVISGVRVVDGDGNEQDYDSNSRRIEGPTDISLQSGWDRDFTVTDTSQPPPETTKAGTLQSLSFSPKVVDATEGPKHVLVTASFSSPEPRHVRVSFYGQSRHHRFNGRVTLKPGEHHTWAGRLTVGQWAGNSTAQVYVNARYAANLKPRYRNYDGQKLTARHLPSSLKIRSGVDSTPPVVTSFSVTPGSIDTTSAPETATITADATDAQSGTRSIYVSISHRGRAGGYFNTRLKPEGGAFAGQITFPKCIAPGAWKISVSPTDRAGNGKQYRAKALTAAGLPASVQVTSTPVDNVPPFVSSATASAIDHSITLDFDEGVKNVSMSTLTVYALKPAASRFQTPASVTSLVCSDGFSVIDCDGSGSLVTSARLMVPAVTGGAKFQVWANQNEVTTQVTDQTGNPLNWSYAVVQVTGS